MNGIIVVNKPSGMSSNAVVSKVKSVLKAKKVGHLGTLDPLAMGVLPVCVGKATKLFDYYLDKSKTYRATFTFGKTTDTLDSEGKVTETCEKIPTKDELILATKKFVGTISQIPPKFSAKNMNGTRAYELSRKGIDFELSPKTITINQFELLEQLDENTFSFKIDCSSGTYIRALARDLAKEVGSLAYMSALLRTRSGNFTLTESVNLENISESDVIPLEKVLSDLEKVCVDEKNFDKLKNGNKIEWNMPDCDNFLLYCSNTLFGIASAKNKIIKIKVNLYE